MSHDKVSDWWNTPGQGKEIGEDIKDLYSGKIPDPPPPDHIKEIFENEK